MPWDSDTAALNAERDRLAALLAGSPFRAYAYGYPHKTAYRPLDPAVPLTKAWAEEDKGHLAAYVHIPFCEMRCGFCNLFTTANPTGDRVATYMGALARQATVVANSLGSARFARLALGGGTPTLLPAAALDRLFALLRQVLGVNARAIPTSVETSPGTATAERLSVLAHHGVDRVSLGVQSLIPQETRAMGRPQDPTDVHRAVALIREAGIPILNVDLIYGAHQDADSWQRSLDQVTAWRAEEVYLYPLYVRPLTGLGRSGGGLDPAAWDRHRLAAYRQGRDHLLTAGYHQLSFRSFRRADCAVPPGPPFDCTADGMVGLGCGARSYTTGLHYSGDYAVGRRAVLDILDAWSAQSDADFALARHGIALDGEEHRRRAALLQLLQSDGIALDPWRRRFGSPVMDALPQLGLLEERGLAQTADGTLRLTPQGLEASDVLGPWLTSPAIRDHQAGWQWR